MLSKKEQDFWMMEMIQYESGLLARCLPKGLLIKRVKTFETELSKLHIAFMKLNSFEVHIPSITNLDYFLISRSDFISLLPSGEFVFLPWILVLDSFSKQN